jgi:hypothetical protein
MIREFAKLFELTVRELRRAAVRIERQSGLVLRTRLRLRRCRKRWRKMRRRWRQTSRAPEAGPPDARYHEWIVRESKYGRLYWVCQWCDCRTLRPSTQHEQRVLKQLCPDAPKQVAKCS